MALRYECTRCGAVRSDTAPCSVCASSDLRPVHVRVGPRARRHRGGTADGGAAPGPAVPRRRGDRP